MKLVLNMTCSIPKGERSRPVNHRSKQGPGKAVLQKDRKRTKVQGDLNATKVFQRAKLLGVRAAKLGTVGGDTLTIKTAGLQVVCPVTELHDAWWNSLARIMKQ
jgi:hypothetical protein